MKKIVLAALVAFTAAPAAFAMSNQTLTDSDKVAIRMVVPGADLDNLSASDAAALSSALYGSDRKSETGQAIRSILLNAGPVEASRATSSADAVPFSGNTTMGHNDR